MREKPEVGRSLQVQKKEKMVILGFTAHGLIRGARCLAKARQPRTAGRRDRARSARLRAVGWAHRDFCGPAQQFPIEHNTTVPRERLEAPH
jgi:hypothetical protein